MAYVVPAVLGGLALAVMALVSSYASRKRTRSLHQPAEIHHSRVLVHSINDDRCTGCDACVAVCPTNVLDLVENKSRVLHFQDCIQCEACMWACPTTALVMHPEGTEPPLYKMPELDEFYQTAIPGQYLIGEVAGKPLVKNAANLGRGVVEHMLKNGLRPGGNPSVLDVAIVGSGPGGLSAALTCIQRGLSYVVLDKENIIASTVARYPKGKLIMAEPYDIPNLSFLPVFDSSKEEMIPIWQELVDQLGIQVRLNHTVETVQKRADGLFDVHIAGGPLVAQRVILATGLRGKPRTLGVPGENQSKVYSLLEDPDDFRGQAVCVVGGGDSALEAALALADAGAKVVLSYRGRSFSRAQPKNKQQVEAYASQRRIKVKYMSQVVEFGPDTVTLQMQDGTQKRYPNHAAFVLIGADPPIKWLNKLGVHYVERPHMFALSASDDLVRQFLGENVRECPTTATAAAALVQGRPVSELEAPRAPSRSGIHMAPDVSKPRRFLRAATQIFRGGQKLDKPMPLSEFARQQRRHSGRGRRDALDAGERTRILRMLRDDGARRADEDSKVAFLQDLAQPDHATFHEPPPVEPIGVEAARRRRPAPSSVGGFIPNGTTSGPPPAPGGAMPKPAVIVGLARATAQGPRQSRGGGGEARPKNDLPELFRLPDSGPGAASGRLEDEPTRFDPAPAFPIEEPTEFMGDEQRARALAGRPPPPVPSPPALDFEDEKTTLASFDPQELMRRAEEADAGLETERNYSAFDTQRQPPRPPPVPRGSTKPPPPPPRSQPRFSTEDIDAATNAIDLNRAPSAPGIREGRAMAAASGGHGEPGSTADTHIDSLSEVDWDLE